MIAVSAFEAAPHTIKMYKIKLSSLRHERHLIMTHDDGTEEKALSRKELAKKMRREAYLRAKEKRKNDPREIARKAEARELRRAQYQKAKERVKAEKERSKAHAANESEARTSLRDKELQQKLRRGTELAREQAELHSQDSEPQAESTALAEVITVDFRSRFKKPKPPR